AEVAGRVTRRVNRLQVPGNARIGRSSQVEVFAVRNLALYSHFALELLSGPGVRIDRHTVPPGAGHCTSDVVGGMVSQQDGAQTAAVGLSVENGEESLLFLRRGSAGIEKINRTIADDVSVRMGAGRQSLRIKRNQADVRSKADGRAFSVGMLSQQGW